MILLLKKIKYFLIHNHLSLYLKNFFIFIFKFNFFKNNKINPKFLGKFEFNLNWKNFDELLLINNNNLDIHHIQSMRNFLDKDTVFFLYQPKSELLLNFIKQTLNSNLVIFDNDKKKNREFNSENNELSFFKKIEEYKEFRKILILDSNFKNINKFKIYLNRFEIILSKNEVKSENIKKYYNYIYDYFEKINPINKFYNKKYYLYSRTKLLNEKNEIKIGGIGLLKNLDLYPFDVCYESVMNFVDEFTIGIDIKSFNNKYDKILNDYLDQTKFKQKIKTIFFDFKTETTNNIQAHGRWVADVFNHLSNQSRSEYLLCMNADEFFDEIRIDQINLTNENYDQYDLKFLHLVKDFNYIRDPKFAAYNDFMRVFKRDSYVSTDDGMGFRKNNNYRPNGKKTDIDIFHLGYLLDDEEKVKNHFTPGGLFYDQMTVDEFYKNMYPVPIDKQKKSRLINRLNKFNYLNGYQKLKKYID